jgi:hypothetical protein
LNLRHRSWPFLAAVLLIALVAAWPAVSQPGLLNTRGGGDSPFLLQRLHQLVTAVADGHFPARWMPDANYGHGYPFYNFYAPLSLYIAAAFRFLGFSFVRAIHLAHIAGFLVAGLAMYALGRNWLGSRWAGVLAAAAYTLAPFHMVNVYVRGDSLAEFWAMAFYPLVLLAADGVLGAPPDRRWRRVALFGLAYAALILSHNISALIFTPFLLLYLGLRWLWPRRAGARPPDGAAAWRRGSSALTVVAGLALALALAAWFFVPALAEQDLAQLGPVTEGYFNYTNHFRGLDLIQPTLLFDYSPDGGTAFRMGLVQAILATLGGGVLFVYTVRRRPEARAGPARLLFIGLAALVATFMITPLSRPLWDHLPLLSFTQFPWRFLSVQALAMALLTAGLAWPVGRAAIVPVAALLLLLGGLLGLRTDHLILTDADVTAERLAQYEWFTGNIGTTVSAEYLPPGVVPRPYSSGWLTSGVRGRPVALEGQLVSADLLVQQTDHQQWLFTTGQEGAVVLLPTLYWPEWIAQAGSAYFDLAPQAGSGLMRLALPPGEHTVDIRLELTPVRRWSEWLSLLALIVTAVLLLARGQWRGVGRGLLVVGGAAVLLAGGAWVLRQTDPKTLPPDDLTWDFAQMGYLHHDTTGVPFQDGSHLYSYGYSQDAIRAGETLTVTLNMDMVQGAQATLDLATAALARPVPRDEAHPPILVATMLEPDQEPVVAALDIPANAPAGLYVPRLTLSGARPLMPSGQTRGDLFLRPVRILPAGGPPVAPLTITDEPFAADIRADALFVNDDGALEGHFTWVVNRSPGRNLQISWRALDGAGGTLAQLDTQPGYGFNPTTGWPERQPIHDRLTLRLPESLSEPSPYPLVMILYDPTDGRELMRRRLGELVEREGQVTFRTIAPAFTVPSAISPLNITLSEAGRPLITLHGSTLGRSDGTLDLTLVWGALADMPTDYRRFVHLINPTGDIVAQYDGHPAAGSYPTSQWQVSEVVEDRVTFDLTALPPGTYQLATGFYRPEDQTRLDVTGPDGPLPDGRIILSEIVQLP